MGTTLRVKLGILEKYYLCLSIMRSWLFSRYRLNSFKFGFYCYVIFVIFILGCYLGIEGILSVRKGRFWLISQKNNGQLNEEIM